MKNLSQKDLEIKAVGSAIECGTLALLLSALPVPQDVYLMSLERLVPDDLRQGILHLTAQPYLRGPIYYLSVLTFEILGFDQAASLIYPYRGQATQLEETLVQAQSLQQQAFEVLKTHLEHNSHVSRVRTPGRHRLPDEWVWTGRSRNPDLVYQAGQWQIKDDRRG